MSLLFKRAATLSDRGVPSRTARGAGTVAVTSETSLTHSAVWACLRLRANLISTLPADEYRRTGGVQREVSPRAPILDRPGALFPGGPAVSWSEWMFATQLDMDRFGNCFGLISWGPDAFPLRIDLTSAAEWSVSVRNGELEYRYRGALVDRMSVWHERQYVVPGLPVGLSPIAYAAMAIGQYLSAQQFTLDWFGNSTVPAGRLKNTSKKITPGEADLVKRRFKAAVQSGDVFVHGADWEFDLMAAQASQAQFLETQGFSISDVARFLDVPGDLIDAETSTGSVTYANMTQRNLQLLVTSLGPAIKRREDAWTAARPKPRYVKLNTDALLRMDPKTRYDMLAVGVDKRAITPNEWRELDDRPPLTPEQEAEFGRLFGARNPEPTPTVPPKGSP